MDLISHKSANKLKRLTCKFPVTRDGNMCSKHVWNFERYVLDHMRRRRRTCSQQLVKSDFGDGGSCWDGLKRQSDVRDLLKRLRCLVNCVVC